MKKLTTVEWATRRRDLLRAKWEITGRVDLKVRYGVQAAELTKVLDYIAAHQQFSSPLDSAPERAPSTGRTVDGQVSNRRSGMDADR